MADQQSIGSYVAEILFDVQKARTDTKALTDDVEKLDKALTGNATATKAAAGATTQLAAGQEVLKKSSRELAAEQQRLQRANNQTQQTLGNLLFLIQDAPYGFRGMANNIDFVVRGFIMLRTEMGSTGGAMAALKSAMTGPVGIMFAVSAVMALIQILGNAFRETGKEAKTAAEDGLKKYNDMLDEIAKKMEKFTPEVTAARRETLTSNLENAQKRKALLEKIRKDMEDGMNGILTPEEGIILGATEGKTALEDLLTVPKVDEEGRAIKLLKRLQMEIDKMAEDARRAATELAALGSTVTAESPMLTQKEADDQAAAARAAYLDWLAEQEKAAEKAMDKWREDEIKRVQDIFKMERQLWASSGKDKWENERRQAQAEFDIRANEIMTLSKDEAEQTRLIGIARIQYANTLADIEKRRIEFERKAQEEILRDDLQRLDRMAAGVDQIGNALQRAFKGATDTFYQKMLAILQIAIQIARVMKQAELSQAQGNGDPLGAYLQVAGAFFGFFSFANKPNVPQPEFGSSSAVANLNKNVARRGGIQPGSANANEIPEFRARIDIDNGTGYFKRIYPEVKKFNDKKTVASGY